MPVKQTIPFSFGTFFITFTCYKWIPLIEKVNGYDIIYNWFDHLKKQGHYINGYVIMPNHIHVLVSFIATDQLINTIVGNGKRFMAYEIIKRLTAAKDYDLLNGLASAVEQKRRDNNKKHEVWELSFDWKLCESLKFVDQKLSYMDMNLCTEKWKLCISPVGYLHSSAKYYISEEQGIYSVTNIMEMQDVQFIKK